MPRIHLECLVVAQKAKGFSTKELGRRAKVDPRHIRRLKRGEVKFSHDRTVESLASALEIDRDVLIGVASMPESILDRAEALGVDRWLLKLAQAKIGDREALAAAASGSDSGLGRARGFVQRVLGSPRAMAVAGALPAALVAVLSTILLVHHLDRPEEISVVKPEMDFALVCIAFDGDGPGSTCNAVVDTVVAWGEKDSDAVNAIWVAANPDGDAAVFMHSTDSSGPSMSTWSLMQFLRRSGVEIEWTADPAPAPFSSNGERT